MAKDGQSVLGHLRGLPWVPGRPRSAAKQVKREARRLTRCLVSAWARGQRKPLPQRREAWRLEGLEAGRLEQNHREQGVWDPQPWADGLMFPRC